MLSDNAADCTKCVELWEVISRFPEHTTPFSRLCTVGHS